MAQNRSAKRRSGARPSAVTPPKPASAAHPNDNVKWWREAIESLVIAIVLALLIRAFEAEAFVIPTGSMAPTLQGRHKDVKCPSCGYRYRAGASEDTELGRRGPVTATVCPMCTYVLDLEGPGFDSNAVSFTGDRILVNKFSYDLLGQPQRFDVIVFKYPGNAKQNYIKRLIGLPGEQIRIQKGDIHVRTSPEDPFQIVRKPPGKMRALLQLVHDTRYVPEVLDRGGLPSRWQPDPNSPAWTTEDAGRTFTLDGRQQSDFQWIRYRHIAPSLADWQVLADDPESADLSDRRGMLITDFYAYNAPLHARDNLRRYLEESGGQNWVGDLAVECHVEVASDTGRLGLDLVEGGWHFRCEIDVADGTAELSIDGGAQQFTTADGVTLSTIGGSTPLRGRGKYRLLFSNVDNELRLWVNGRLCQLEHPATYDRGPDFRPQWLPNDPGDLAPAGVGGQDIALNVSRLRVHRDVYYVAVTDHGNAGAGANPSVSEYLASHLDSAPLTSTVEGFYTHLQRVLTTPELWASTPLFENPPSVEFTLQDFPGDHPADQFFPLGDNSPQSRDARIWCSTWRPSDGGGLAGNQNYVTRDMLIGKAVFIYWPHPWLVRIPGTNVALPLLPNVLRMGIIR